MTAEPIDVDLDDLPEFAAIVEKLLASGQPRQLRRGKKVVGVLSPALGAKGSRAAHRREPTPDQIAAFESAAGGWRDNVDVDRFLEENYVARRASTRPRVDL